jgi:hypothetical protein
MANDKAKKTRGSLVNNEKQPALQGNAKYNKSNK